MASSAVAEKVAGRGKQSRIVNCDHRGHALFTTRVQDRWAHKRKGVVEVNDIGSETSYDLTQCPSGPLAPDNSHRHRRPFGPRPLGYVVAVTLETFDDVTLFEQGFSFLVDDAILATGGTGSVPIVQNEDLHLLTTD